MSLSISTTNALIDAVPTITDAGAGENPANISDPNHSLNYTCGTSSAVFEVSYGARSNISYVGVSGHNAATLAAATIQVWNAGALIDTVTIVRNNNVMFTFPEQSFSNLIIKFVTSPSTYQTTVSYIAAGKHLDIQTGEQAGYNRAWLNRHDTIKTTTNLIVAPVSSIRKAMPLKGALSFPNQSAEFTEDEWQMFIDFSFDQPFFVKEQEDKPQSSYICFDPKHSVKAHQSTRLLNVTKVKFITYTGL